MHMNLNVCRCIFGLLCGVWLAPAQAGEKTEKPEAGAALSDAEAAKLIPGKWRGWHVAGGGVFHHEINVVPYGRVWMGQGLTWYLVSGEEALAAARGVRPQTKDAKAGVVAQQFSVEYKNGVLTFKGIKAQPLFQGMKYNPDLFSAPLTASGIIGGQGKDIGGMEALFRLGKADVLESPQPLTLEKGKTHKLGCLEGGSYHYNVYIPKNYDQTKPTPVLINCSPGGNAGPLSIPLADELGWLMVGLVESKNGPIKEPSENMGATVFDLRRRFNIHPRRVYFSGFSGGARMASWAGWNFQSNCGGLICIGAGFNSDARPPRGQPVFFIVGKTDMNYGEVTTLQPQEKKAGRVCELIVHPEGHTWGRKEDQEAAIRWLEKLAGPPAPGKKN
jgi:dienelactone hydrolase